jgi:hypothetical protein
MSTTPTARTSPTMMQQCEAVPRFFLPASAFTPPNAAIHEFPCRFTPAVQGGEAAHLVALAARPTVHALDSYHHDSHQLNRTDFTYRNTYAAENGRDVHGVALPLRHIAVQLVPDLRKLQAPAPGLFVCNTNLRSECVAVCIGHDQTQANFASAHNVETLSIVHTEAPYDASTVALQCPTFKRNGAAVAATVEYIKTFNANMDKAAAGHAASNTTAKSGRMKTTRSMFCLAAHMLKHCDVMRKAKGTPRMFVVPVNAENAQAVAILSLALVIIAPTFDATDPADRIVTPFPMLEPASLLVLGVFDCLGHRCKAFAAEGTHTCLRTKDFGNTIKHAMAGHDPRSTWNVNTKNAVVSHMCWHEVTPGHRVTYGAHWPDAALTTTDGRRIPRILDSISIANIAEAAAVSAAAQTPQLDDDETDLLPRLPLVTPVPSDPAATDAAKTLVHISTPPASPRLLESPVGRGPMPCPSPRGGFDFDGDQQQPPPRVDLPPSSTVSSPALAPVGPLAVPITPLTSWNVGDMAHTPQTPMMLQTTSAPSPVLTSSAFPSPVLASSAAPSHALVLDARRHLDQPELQALAMEHAAAAASSVADVFTTPRPSPRSPPKARNAGAVHHHHSPVRHRSALPPPSSPPVKRARSEPMSEDERRAKNAADRYRHHASRVRAAEAATENIRKNEATIKAGGEAAERLAQNEAAAKKADAHIAEMRAKIAKWQKRLDEALAIRATTDAGLDAEMDADRALVHASDTARASIDGLRVTEAAGAVSKAWLHEVDTVMEAAPDTPPPTAPEAAFTVALGAIPAAASSASSAATL